MTRTRPAWSIDAKVVSRLLQDGGGLEVDSPIEAIFALAFALRLNSERHGPLDECAIDLASQVQIGSHRVDFLVEAENVPAQTGAHFFASAVVECDGREFHHSEWQQIERDRRRDAKIETHLDGKVFRFPGAQIYSDPLGCAGIVLDYLESRLIEHYREHAA